MALVSETTTTKRGARGAAQTSNRKVGAALVRLGDRNIRKDGDTFEIPKTELGKTVFKALTGAAPVGRGEWARVAADEIDPQQLDQLIAALSAIRYSLPSSAPAHPVAARLIELGYPAPFALQIAADPFYTVEYIDAHWSEIQGDPNVNNQRAVMRHRISVKQAAPKVRSKYAGWDNIER